MKSFFESEIWPLKNKLYRFALLWLKDRDKAQDAVQETLTRGFVHARALEKMDNPKGWMMRTLKNESLMQIRREGRYEVLDEAQVVEMHGNLESADFSHEVKMVYRFLDLLPAKQREIFFLREVEGLMHQEIAGYMEISEAQVKVNLHRARKKLKTYLQNNEKGQI
ncbi:RNA polymerase sigma-70 factor, ECF subfamily [Cyclobacterium lianum]|uniref:RNA polymerase sigma-70 factor, ECF subfamily n=1 Tax=Cyclobacterium lianum TaxID=388280 RepID=A0A1M7KHB7_9BACT|nr:sigma-70 family RNA polymerase sigma factor [Cyclobacterium lianum]SHM64625.1 RNA polymerase sigma-70 factor, ECF subfamily [Cyclobacterium lianum]